MLLWIAVLAFLVPAVLGAQATCTGCNDGTVSSGTDNQVACYDGAGTTLADCDTPVTVTASGVSTTGTLSAEPGGNIGPCKKYTKAVADLTDADTSEDEVLFNLPARGKVWAVNIKHSTAFSGGTLSAMTVSVGDSSSPTLYATAFDTFQAVGATVFQDGPASPNFVSSTWVARDVFARFTSTGDNMNNVTAGSVDIHVCWLVLPL